MFVQDAANTSVESIDYLHDPRQDEELINAANDAERLSLPGSSDTISLNGDFMDEDHDLPALGKRKKKSASSNGLGFQIPTQV